MPHNVLTNHREMFCLRFIVFMLFFLVIGPACSEENGMLPTTIRVSDGNCALLSDGTVRCWGRGYAGQLGNGTTTHFSYTPVQVKGLSTVTRLASATLYTCALLEDQTIFCWGMNTEGPLGNGRTEDSLIPTQVVGMRSAVAVASGGSHTCAILQDGTIRCWGRNSRGQLGDGTIKNSLIPIKVRGIRQAVAVAIGNRHTCAILRDRTVMCWGLNERGELGDGTGKDSHVPVVVQDLTGVIDIAAGDEHTCAVRDDNTVWCWGRGYAGQLGNGKHDWAYRPVKVKGLTSAQAVAGGSMAHTCALLQDGTVWCWGMNSAGQLGAPSKPDSALPVQVIGIPAARAISLSGESACALTVEQSLLCWGGIYQYKPDLDKYTPTPVEIIIPAIKDSESSEVQKQRSDRSQ